MESDFHNYVRDIHSSLFRAFRALSTSEALASQRTTQISIKSNSDVQVSTYMDKCMN